LHSAAPTEMHTLAIYKGVVPFICQRLITLELVYIYPGIATWLLLAIGR
jgi:TRAP-type mannitol/chloroaromatic compound transport system permease large subunit